MNWDLVQDAWKQIADKAGAQWEKLTADDFYIEVDRREQLAGNSRKRHGMAQKGADNEMSEKQRQAIELWFAKD